MGSAQRRTSHIRLDDNLVDPRIELLVVLVSASAIYSFFSIQIKLNLEARRSGRLLAFNYCRTQLIC